MRFISAGQDATLAPALLMTWVGKATCGPEKINGQGALVPLWLVHNSLNRNTTQHPPRDCRARIAQDVYGGCLQRGRGV